MSNITYISFDPGGSSRASTGVATWDDRGANVAKLKFTARELNQFLIDIEPIASDIKVFIVETYIGRPGMAYGGNKMKTSQQIGAIKWYAQRHGITVAEQGADKKEIGKMYSGIKKTWKHMPDDISAYCHGYYYLQINKIIRPKILDAEL